ncbi:unnamed protein product [Hermetia illucens]|uniref:Aldehyde dehydrogenase domain-containing protein n=1 Tax=Hermetia illucens TaxID=343691 RepID=A0A7R8Z1S6_HERIL|nr:aldehyde dehydrogenase X, mitochondrial-like [Hermetia illucens]XP_037924316.1 aldehyde dehydrogenase X, mitochondrial-like [Hermetia illucens]CAD7092253.1 unnamed protein product [Hermetia illucens]
MSNPKQPVKYTKLFINNEFVDAVSKKTFPTINPATKEKIADIAEGNAADVDLAVEAARAAFNRKSDWRKLDAAGRAKLITKLADLINRDINILANLESMDNGKPFSQALLDVDRAVQTLKYYADWADKYFGETVQAPAPLVSMTRKEPVGVVGQIIPWNYPLVMLAWKFGPALATGCTIVLKPAEQTPLTALYVAALSKEAGFPDGVINVITGYGPTAGAAISGHMGVNKVAFTGSVQVGKLIMKAAAESNLKRVTLELGGKSPLVICEDVNLDEAAAIAHDAIFANHGQNCCAGSRTFVHESIYNEFVEKASDLAKQRKVGNPFVEGIMQGPQVDAEMYHKVMEYIQVGKSEGAKIETGGKPASTAGYFVEPTVFSNVTDDMKIAKEEIFGPVQSILKFRTLDEVIERANRTSYGLAAGIVTKDINKAMKFAQEVEAGSVWINCYNAVILQAPFGGFKQSGIGRELGKDALENYLETKTITMRIADVN